MKRIVIALGGNALGNDTKEANYKLKQTAKHIVDIIEMGHEVVVTHGNGPQVGMIYNAFKAYAKENKKDVIPFAECGSMSQGYIGYGLQDAIQDEMNKRKIAKKCATVVTRVEVDKKDPAFKSPTKPIGDFYSEKEAKELEKLEKAIYMEDAGRGYRRVVPSPEPEGIIELDVIEELVRQNFVVVSCGGGGVPVVHTPGGYEGIDAVIDKDKTSALLARKLNADCLLILTTVDKVLINYKKPNEKKLDKVSLEEAKEYIADSQFANGSMLPKVEACIDFVESTDNKAIITSLEQAKEAILGGGGTIFYREEKEKMKEEEKKTTEKRRGLKLSAFSIIFLLIFLLGAVTYFLPVASFVSDGVIVDGSGVLKAKLSQVLLSPIKGFADAIDICLFVLILGAFLKVVNESRAIETGIEVIIRKLKGRELILIPILMFLFSIGGTTYGMLEETVGFYALLSGTMVMAGMDTIVASATVLLGAGVGVLGSTINPFAVGAAVSALPEGINVDQGIIIGLGLVLWIVSYIVATLAVTRYAKKVIKDKGSTFLSLQEQQAMKRNYGRRKDSGELQLNDAQKGTLILFGLTFLVMIISFIPWKDFGIKFFGKIPHFLTGVPLGEWYFQEASLWFLIMTIVIGVMNKMKEEEFVDTFIKGGADMIGVMLIIALARGAYVLMSETYLDNYIIINAANTLKGVPALVFAPLNYLLHVVLSILVPSSSGLAALSTPIMGSLANQVGYSVEVTIMEMVAANGLVNLITPTCGAIMGGLALAKVEYTTWFKWAGKLVLLLGLISMVILTAAMVIL